MLAKLLILFTVVPLVEFWLLFKIAHVTSATATILLVIVTGVIGAALARREGLRVWQQIHAEIGQGKMPGDRLIDALMILVAGALLVTPGVLTDCVGFGLLIPPIRAIIRKRLKSAFRTKVTIVSNFQSPFQSPGDPPYSPPDNVIDVESRVVDEDEDPSHNQ